MDSVFGKEDFFKHPNRWILAKVNFRELGLFIEDGPKDFGQDKFALDLQTSFLHGFQQLNNIL